MYVRNWPLKPFSLDYGLASHIHIHNKNIFLLVYLIVELHFSGFFYLLLNACF